MHRTDDGHQIDVRTYGIIDLGASEAATKVFTLQPDMASVPFGVAGKSVFWISWAIADSIFFEPAARTEYIVSDPRLKFLESSFIVGNAQVIIDQNGVTIENRQSLVLTPGEGE
jgi:hypothetical protein